MDGPRNTIDFPILAVASVVGYDAEHNAVYIRLPSGQQPILPARMLYQGNADQYRVYQMPLPLIGTWGVVAFPANDDRFPIWLGSYYSTILDAITSSSIEQDTQIEYKSHWSGYYDLLDGFGNYYSRFPDGTDIRISGNNIPPATYRHIIDPNQVSQYGTPQIRTQLGNAERVPAPPPSNYVSINHPSGASATITPSGMVTITAGNPQLSSITMTPSGIITVSAGNSISSQTTPQIVLNAQTGVVQIFSRNQNGLITMDGTGNIVIQSAGGNVLIEAANNIAVEASSVTLVEGNTVVVSGVGGDISLITPTHPESLNTIVNVFNGHTHPDPQGGNTGIPNQQLP